MMSIRSLADFNRSSLGGDGDWLTPPPSPPRPDKPGRHDERGMRTFNWPPARTSTWPYTGTLTWPRTLGIVFLALVIILAATKLTSTWLTRTKKTAVTTKEPPDGNRNRLSLRRLRLRLSTFRFPRLRAR